jgi:hypothetical protein
MDSLNVVGMTAFGDCFGDLFRKDLGYCILRGVRIPLKAD